MPDKARRLPSRAWLGVARRALLMSSLWMASTASAEEIISAVYADPTTRYAHAVLGDDIEYGTLVIGLRSGEERRFVLPQSAVFEDTAPRRADLNGDGSPEVITVESHQTQGARLAIYDATGRIAATPYIGTRFRWLAPLGAADLDGDGKIELAYIDRPHLAKTLRIWRFDAGDLIPLADLPGLTNHRIGERDIAGGIRTCGASPEMILATANWSRVVAVTFPNGQFQTKDLGPHKDRSSFAAAMACAN
jgi:hypothetical protein